MKTGRTQGHEHTYLEDSTRTTVVEGHSHEIKPRKKKTEPSRDGHSHSIS